MLSFVAYGFTFWLWMGPTEIRQLSPIEFTYGSQAGRYNPERGFVVLRESAGRFPFYHDVFELKYHDRLDDDPSWNRGMRVALYDGKVSPRRQPD